MHIIFRPLSGSQLNFPYLKYSNLQTQRCQKRFHHKATNYMQHRCDVGENVKKFSITRQMEKCVLKQGKEALTFTVFQWIIHVWVVFFSASQGLAPTGFGVTRIFRTPPLPKMLQCCLHPHIKGLGAYRRLCPLLMWSASCVCRAGMEQCRKLVTVKVISSCGNRLMALGTRWAV